MWHSTRIRANERLNFAQIGLQIDRPTSLIESHSNSFVTQRQSEAVSLPEVPSVRRDYYGSVEL